MQRYVVLEKKVGQTPLQAVELFREKEGLSKDVRLAYAGRLDPLASGKLLVLIGDECKKQDSYLELDKGYTFETLFGFSTDTGDVLGLAEKAITLPEVTQDTLKEVAHTLLGKQSFPYPVFSSKTVHNKPLLLWALEGRIDEIEIPTKESTVYTLKLTDSRTITKADIYEQIFTKINSIPKVTEASKGIGNDFRRSDIRARWNKLFEKTPQDTFQIATFTCIASSGTYMRTLAAEIGKALGTHSLAFSIHRTHIGKYQKFSPFGFWKKQF